VNILQELTEIYMNGSEEEQANVLHLVEDYLGEEKVWTPNDGPQMDAYYSEADVLLYGGAAGGGKKELSSVERQPRPMVWRRKVRTLLETMHGSTVRISNGSGLTANL
jgi:hypothetical protein